MSTLAPADTSVPPVLVPSKSHLPSLDGMRAFSILLVVLSHSFASFRHPTNYYELFLGQLGVTIFLVISGLLITWMMIRERNATGSFSLKNFYIRRCLRILPVFWALLLAVTALKIAHVISIPWSDILRALTFTHNYPFSIHPPAEYSWWLLHTWSLSLEEQFYLIWPSLFFFLPRRFAPRLAVALVLAGPILRWLSFSSQNLIGFDRGGIQTHIDILMAGCASAFLLESPAWKARIEKIPVAPALAVAAFYLLLASPAIALHQAASRIPGTLDLFRPTLDAVAITISLLAMVAGKRGSAFHIVNLPVARHIGKLSYSLYIWQELFLVEGAAINFPSFAWRLGATYLTAFCSFNFLERPLIRLRSQFRHGVSI